MGENILKEHVQEMILHDFGLCDITEEDIGQKNKNCWIENCQKSSDILDGVKCRA